MHALKRGLLAFCLIAITMSETVKGMAVQSVNEGTQLFSTDFVKTVAKQQRENLICSPLSADIALTMASLGAGGQTKAQFTEVLKHPPSELATKQGFQNLIDTLNNVENVTLKLANKMYVGKNFLVKPDYQSALQSYFRSDIESVDFLQKQATVKIINDWCKLNTNNRIDSIVQPDDLNPNTALLLANAVYFKGKWANEFDPKATTDRPFHIDANNVKDVPTMYRKGNYKFAELPEHEAKCIELPYANKDISMVIILPDKVDGLSKLQENLNTVVDACNTRLQQTYEREVKLYLPKFKTETKLDLTDTLSNEMGLSDPFSDGANFNGISDQPLKISKVVQKAFIEVNEEGSEAAAVTAILFVPLSAHWGTPHELRINRPFYYTIRYKRRSSFSSLFAGQVRVPRMR